MTYKSLYRSYRPQRFEEIAGQNFIVRTLKNAISQDKLAHAYLFTGPRGTGKTSIAKILARAVNCTGVDKPCNKCDSCLASLNNSHPDIIEIDAASNNSVDEMRDLIDRIKYAPLLGRKKVYIVDEVHMLTTGAFNAFLKTLEEPPAHVTFILATTEPHKIIPTILSRCQRFDYNKISITDIKSRLATILNEEGIKHDEETISLIAELADGGMRDALTITDQAIAYAGEKIDVAAVQEIYGILTIKEKIHFLNLLLNKDIVEALNLADQFNEKGIDLFRLTNELVTILKDVAVAALARTQITPLVLSFEEINKLRDKMTLSMALSFIEILNDAPRAAGAKRMMEMIILKIVSKLNEEDSAMESSLKKAPLAVNKVVAEKKAEEPVKSVINKEMVTDNIASKVQKESISAEVKINFEEKKIEKKEVITSKTDYTIKDIESIEVTKEALMNVLVQANKELKAEYSTSWEKMNAYINDFQYNLPALILIDAKILAACREAVIITYRRDAQVITAKRKNTYDQLIALINKITGHSPIIYPVLEKEGQELIKEYLKLREQNELPVPQKINSKTNNNETNEKQKDLNSIFGNLIKEE